LARTRRRYRPTTPISPSCSSRHERAGREAACRTSYEMMASVMGSPFDYPLSSRFDRTTPSSCSTMRSSLEDVLLHRDLEKMRSSSRSRAFSPLSVPGMHQAGGQARFPGRRIAGHCVPPAPTGSAATRRAGRGDCLARPVLGADRGDGGQPTPWVEGAVLPNLQSGSSYRVFAGDAYGRVTDVEKIIAWR
jgi:4-hydroxyphenylacetate 3-monooxygenase